MPFRHYSPVVSKEEDESLPLSEGCVVARSTRREQSRFEQPGDHVRLDGLLTLNLCIILRQINQIPNRAGRSLQPHLYQFSETVNGAHGQIRPVKAVTRLDLFRLRDHPRNEIPNVRLGQFEVEQPFVLLWIFAELEAFCEHSAGSKERHASRIRRVAQIDQNLRTRDMRIAGQQANPFIEARPIQVQRPESATPGQRSALLAQHCKA
jgi:hypothetical protein